MKKLIYALMMPFAGHLKHLQKAILQVRFYKYYKRKLQWKNPKSFYDKIIWMSCNADTSLWTWLADKYKVREYVSARCGENLLTKLYGVYNMASEINYEKLPDSFVMKTNNGCASNFLVRDKKNIDTNAINKQFDKWMKYPYGDLTGQLHYSAIKPKIIVEELLVNKSNPTASLVDYKFYCFNGVPLYCHVLSDRKFNTHDVNKMMYDIDWVAHPEFLTRYDNMKELPRPSCFEEMKLIASKLSQNINFVRVDLYEVNGKVYFGEMTFMPGTDCDYSEATCLKFGQLFDEKQLISADEMRKKIGLEE